MHLARLNVDTGEREVLAVLEFGDHEPAHVASATPDFFGNLYFADAGQPPTGMYVYRPSGASPNKTVLSWRDIKQWG
jgi:hypothetical protein